VKPIECDKQFFKKNVTQKFLDQRRVLIIMVINENYDEKKNVFTKMPF
jgi:hypothetical protein